jgi:arylsulfatase A-like enzyme
MTDRPNILWICTDSQRWDTLGCYGNRFVTTPHADRLARQGTRFDVCYAQNPLCMPSRGSFLTGRYPSTTGLRQNGQTCPPDLRPITKDLSDAGYVCGNAGKFHLNNCDARLALGPEWWRHDNAEYFKGAEKRIDDGYDVFLWDHSARTNDPGSAYSQWFRQQGGVDTRRPREDEPMVKHGLPRELHQAKWGVDSAIDFIDGYDTGPHPWCFTLNLFDPHAQFDPPPEFLEPYLDRLEDIPLPDHDPAEFDEKPSLLRQKHEKQIENKQRTDRTHRLVRAAYWAMCDHLDFQLGRLLDRVDLRNTIVIFTSDHGEMLGDHGVYIKGPFMYEPALRVPLIIAGPGVRPDVKGDDLVELADLVPTLRDACGLGVDPAVQGRSLWPTLTRGEPHGRADVYAEYFNANPDKPARYLTTLRTESHKIVRHHGGDGIDAGELYDLRDDPAELRNLWHDPTHRDLRHDLLLRLGDRQVHAACDPLPERVGVF